MAWMVELVEQYDSSQLAIVEDGRHDLRRKTTVRVEHPLERRIVSASRQSS